jgi:hypothetical protein
VRIRRPFYAALLAVLASLAVWRVEPSVAAWWEERQIEHQERAYVASLRPSVAALRRLTLPSGIRACTSEAVSPKGGFCIEGELELHSAVSALADSLRGVGALNVVHECVRLRPELCTVEGEIVGQRFRVLAGSPNGSGGTGPAVVRINGGFGVMAPAPFPSRLPRVSSAPGPR